MLVNTFEGILIQLLLAKATNFGPPWTMVIPQFNEYNNTCLGSLKCLHDQWLLLQTDIVKKKIFYLWHVGKFTKTPKGYIWIYVWKNFLSNKLKKKRQLCLVLAYVLLGAENNTMFCYLLLLLMCINVYKLVNKNFWTKQP